LLCSIVGLYLAARLRSGSSHYGDEYTLLSITATVVGGTSMAGGLGGLSGTLAGTILISMLTNVLNNIAFRYNLQSSYYKDIITGILLITAMYFYRKRE
jgi:ribose/xylose/arabinose/galactoside ABC-type transport system permease subunit